MKMLGVLKSIGSSYEAKIATILIASRVVSQGSRLQTQTLAKEEDKINAYKVGANLFETKPIKPDQLQAYIDILVKS